MKMSLIPINTLRSVNAEEECISYKLMLRAGLIRKASAGIHNYLPLGVKVINNIENLIRKEMEKIDSLEIMSSSLINQEVLKQCREDSERGSKLFRTKDKNYKELYFLDSFQEAQLLMALQEINSHKQLPCTFYEIQKSYVDEAKPKFGLLRARESIIKSACTFAKDADMLDKATDTIMNIYNEYFNKVRLKTRIVPTESSNLEEGEAFKFIVDSELGDENVAYCRNCGYISHLSKAKGNRSLRQNEELKEIMKVETPDIKTIDQLKDFLKVKGDKIVKTLIYNSGHEVIAVLVRGDREVNEHKLKKAIGSNYRLEMADSDTVSKATGAEVGFAGPVGIKVDKLFVDEEIQFMKNFVVGANETNYHYINVNYPRDFNGIIGDFKNVMSGDRCISCGGELSVIKGVEVAKIDKVGKVFSHTMKTTYKNETGEVKPLYASFYEMNLTKVLATIIENNSDSNGILWPLSIAPYEVGVLPVFVNDEAIMEVTLGIYNKLKATGIDVLLDDRNDRVGVKFKDSDLIGIPIRITIGKKIMEGKVEFKLRDESEIEIIAIDEIANRVIREFEKNNIYI